MGAIEVEGLTKAFTTGRRRSRRTTVAVDGITFEVAAGERLAFIGPNGAGKSTSIKMLTGILHPTSGRASVLGLEPWSDRRRLASRIGTLFGQRSQLWTELPPRVSLRMLGAIFDLDDRRLDARIAELGELLDASALLDQPVRTQSLGQRMRCELAACLLHEPDILFLDEPTIGLDLLAKQRFRELLVRVNVEVGTTVFLTSHDVADIEHVAERAIVVNHGVVISDASVTQMRRRLLSAKRIEVGLDHPVDAAAVERLVLSGVTLTAHTPSAVHLAVDMRVRSVRDVVDAVLVGLPVADLSIDDPPLEDVIAGIYRSPATSGEAAT
jgi:ABC-2 type transport system ATP-binding protein